MTDFVPQVLPATTPSLAAGAPPAPPGTLFVLGAHGGYAVPPRTFTLLFGRGGDNVHVKVGLDDPHISRRHGELVCDGADWSMRNRGTLPIRLPGESLLLSGQEIALRSGYLPLFIGVSRRREHLVELRVVGGVTDDDVADEDSDTVAPIPYDLTPTERLVMTALAMRYLRYEKRPQPLSWNQVAKELNQAPDCRDWTWHRASNVVTDLRKRLSTGPDPIEGIMREGGETDPLGNTINHTLIHALLGNATLRPTDLRLLGTLDD